MCISIFFKFTKLSDPSQNNAQQITEWAKHIAEAYALDFAQRGIPPGFRQAISALSRVSKLYTLKVGIGNWEVFDI